MSHFTKKSFSQFIKCGLIMSLTLTTQFSFAESHSIQPNLKTDTFRVIPTYEKDSTKSHVAFKVDEKGNAWFYECNSEGCRGLFGQSIRVDKIAKMIEKSIPKAEAKDVLKDPEFLERSTFIRNQFIKGLGISYLGSNIAAGLIGIGVGEPLVVLGGYNFMLSYAVLSPLIAAVKGSVVFNHGSAAVFALGSLSLSVIILGAAGYTFYTSKKFDKIHQDYYDKAESRVVKISMTQQELIFNLKSLIEKSQFEKESNLLN